MDKPHAHVPPGFRFHPTDEELINFYLKKKVAMEEFDLDHVIPEVDLNKLEPWDLHEKCQIDASHQTEWYFFSHKDKKYPTGTRTNRATAAGFWKATGRDKAVHSSYERIGMRKTLVFYRGRAPQGKKTEWIMHEYRIEDKDDESKGNGHVDMQEDGWVVCRVFKKRNLIERDNNHSNANLSDEEVSETVPHRAKKQKTNEQKTMVTQPETCKQEDMEEDPPSKLPFLQLPHLDSPKATIGTPTTYCNLVDFRLMLGKAGCGGALEQPSSSCSEDGPPQDTMEECSDKASLILEENLTEFNYSGGSLNEGWSVYENIARYHLDFFGFPGDFSQGLHPERTHPLLDYPFNCEVDLWNFTR